MHTHIHHDPWPCPWHSEWSGRNEDEPRTKTKLHFTLKMIRFVVEIGRRSSADDSDVMGIWLVVAPSHFNLVSDNCVYFPWVYVSDGTNCVVQWHSYNDTKLRNTLRLYFGRIFMIIMLWVRSCGRSTWDINFKRAVDWTTKRNLYQNYSICTRVDWKVPIFFLLSAIQQSSASLLREWKSKLHSYEAFTANAPHGRFN